MTRGFILCVTAALLAGCQSSPPATDVLPLGAMQRGSLHCAAGDCSDRYTVEIRRAGVLKVEVYAPIGANQPDFTLVVGDADEPERATSTTPHERPRRVVLRVDAGTYTVRIDGRGDDRSRVSYSVLPRFEPAAAATEDDAVVVVDESDAAADDDPWIDDEDGEPADDDGWGSDDSSDVSDGATVAPPDPPDRGEPTIPDDALRADVLDISVGEGDRSFVFLDAGQPQGLVVGASGLLVHEGDVIGRIEVVEVYRDGSQAALVGELSGEIGIDTEAVFPELR